MNTHVRSIMFTICKLTHLRRMEFLTLINRNSQFPFKKELGGIFLKSLIKFKLSFCMLKGDPHQLLHSVASDLGLRCLNMSYKKDARPILVVICRKLR